MFFLLPESMILQPGLRMSDNAKLENKGSVCFRSVRTVFSEGATALPARRRRSREWQSAAPEADILYGFIVHYRSSIARKSEAGLVQLYRFITVNSA